MLFQCDEQRPSCKRCLSYQVRCDFSSNSDSRIHSSREQVFSTSEEYGVWKVLMPTYAVPRSPVKLGFSELGYNGTELEALQYFQNATVLTLCTAEIGSLYQQTILRLGLEVRLKVCVSWLKY